MLNLQDVELTNASMLPRRRSGNNLPNWEYSDGPGGAGGEDGEEAREELGERARLNKYTPLLPFTVFCVATMSIVVGGGRRGRCRRHRGA